MTTIESAVELLAPEAITLRIATVRGQRVIVDADLAALYGVQTKRFNEAVKRNLAKFPADFMLQLTTDEWAALRSQFATLDAAGTGRGRYRKYLPYAFTEHGAIMAATILSSPRAIEMSVYAAARARHLNIGALMHRPASRGPRDRAYASRDVYGILKQAREAHAAMNVQEA